MRNIKFWCVISILVMAVFMFSGCGGGSLDPQEEETTEETEETTSDTKTYDAAKILPGTWKASDEEIIIEGESVITELMLVSGEMRFYDVNISGDTGSLSVSCNQTWRIEWIGTEMTGEDEAENVMYLDILSMSIERAPASIVRSYGNVWRCEVDDGGYGLVLSIAITSPSSLNVVQNGVIILPSDIMITNGNVIKYKTEFNSRKQ